MAKLYAELTSDKGGRVASKGGDNYMEMRLKEGNSLILIVEYNQENNELHIQDDTENMSIVVNGFQVQ